jgi:hypothetical protein
MSVGSFCVVFHGPFRDAAVSHPVLYIRKYCFVA